MDDVHMNISGESTAVPRAPMGFTYIDGPNDQRILVPTYMVLATKLALGMEESRNLLNVYEAAPGVSPSSFQNTSLILIP